MPFLFPALASAACDIGILYLGHRNYLLQQEFHGSDGVEDDDDTSRRVYHYGYIVWMAAIRLFLLLIPLPYHSFFGKALRCPMLYRLFYGVTLVVLFIHVLTLLMIDPGSLSSLLEAIASYSNDDLSSGRLHHILVTRSLWVALILTLVSTLNHIALFFHVRSTAPIDAEFFGGRRRPKVLLYYAKEKKQLHQNQNGQSEENTERESLLNGFDDDSDPLTIGLPMGGGSENPAKLQFGRNSSHSSSGRAFKEISNKLMMEIQVRLRKAKSEWTKKLEEYQKPLRAATAASNADLPSHHHLSLHSNVTPFRVILELFAGDNNFNHTNNDHGSIRQLDDVYDLDEGAALMLFVPQLLSFLLHGAYESSYPLEEWILEMCKKNLFFAHKCYWFLKAWSLETTSVSVHGSEGDQHQLLSPQPITRLSHSSSLTSFATQEEDSHNLSKLLPEERAVIEDLMRRIMKCGEEPARLLHFGSTVGTLDLESIPPPGTTTATTLFPTERTSYSSSSLTPSSAAGSSLIPVNPLTGVPSQRHFECMSAQRTHGFLSLDNGAMVSASYDQSVLNGNPCGTSYFDSCPVFMEALITIADNLYKVPRELRNAEFKKQLRLLEVEALPCNEIYIPLQNLHHRVWRIVAEESIPLSTKERVPCIICLEVLGYTPEQSVDRGIGKLLKLRSLAGGNKSAIVSEREMVETWRNSPRDPYRRETAFNRVTQGMGKIPDKMKESMQEMQLSMQEMQEQIRHSISHMRETADGIHHNDFWPVHNNASERLESPEEHSISASGYPESPRRDAEAGDTVGAEALSPSKITLSISPEALTPPKVRQPVSPKTPRSTTQKGTMGQWTKSPAPKGTLASTSPLQVIEISDAALQGLSAPTIKQKHNSYQTVATNGNRKISRRRFSKSSHFSSRANQFDLGISGSYSNDYGDDDENDRSEYEMNGDSNNNGAMTPTFSNAPTNDLPKPPCTPIKLPPVVFKENWKEKEDRLRSASAYGNHPGWKLLPVLVKSNDDLRQEQLASQLIQRMALILARDRIPVWLCPYEILALDASGGIIEAIPDTISLASLKKNDPEYTDLKGFFEQYFYEAEMLADAKANFCESLAAYSMVCFLLQIKDRHNGNILLDNRGHLIHIDFGFFFLSSPGKNTGFESAPFKLTREFMTVLGGPDSHLFGIFRTLCYRTFLSLRKHCHEIILLVEMLQLGNEDLACFRGRPNDAIRELRQRFRLDLNDRACLEYVNALIDESLENWRTNWYDRYQRYCVGVL